MDAQPLNIMIIDDNPAIHEDFIKVLSPEVHDDTFKDLDDQLFGEEENETVYAEGGDEFLPGFKLVTSSQGEEGVEKIKADKPRGIEYALAFVDIRMPPGWDGIKTIKEIWKIDPDIQIVICTAHSDYSWEETVSNLGLGDNYLILRKPFDAVTVRQLACALTRKWVLDRETKQHTYELEAMISEKTKSLEKSLSLLRSTIESSSEGILVLDQKKNIIDYNKLFLKIWGLSVSQLKTMDSEKLMKNLSKQLKDPKPFHCQLASLERAVDANSTEILYLKNKRVIESNSQPYYLESKIRGRVWNYRDITREEQLKQKLEYQASHDVLTGLANRSLLHDRLEQAMHFAARNKKNLAVLFFDLDRFKLVNDSLSHSFGDALLQEVARRLVKTVRKTDTLARLGGDEFVVVVPDVDDESNIAVMANKLLNIFKTPFKTGRRNIMVSTSMGISVYPQDGKSVDQLLKNADLSMYKAKERGGNQFYFYTKTLNSITQKRFKIEEQLRVAIAKDEFFLEYQPQFSIDSKKLFAMEVLIRWQHPKKGLILPLDFIRIAEDSGLIIPLGEWVLKAVCRQLNAWRVKGYKTMPVAVNVASQQLKQDNFAKTIDTILRDFRIDPGLIELEITENVIMTHPDIIGTVNEIKALGINIILDDFGTGNSSINYLKHIDFGRLKIDKSFVGNIHKSASDEVIIEAIIAMAKSFNFDVLAEGVETEQQLQYLKDHKCNEVQGFLFSKPISSTLIEQYLEKQKKTPET